MKKRWYLAVLFIIYLTTLTITAQADDIVNDRLVEAIIAVESSGNKSAIGMLNGKPHAYGLMQITEAVLKEHNRDDLEWAKTQTLKQRNGYGLEYYGNKTIADLFDARFNIIVGIYYLQKLQDHYGCRTTEEVLAGYHIGPSALKALNYDWKRSKAAREYVKKVIVIYDE